MAPAGVPFAAPGMEAGGNAGDLVNRQLYLGSIRQRAGFAL
jgi:hypothetical protein